MTFQIDWFSFAVALIVFVIAYNGWRVLSAYLKLRTTKKQIKILDAKLKEINQKLEANQKMISAVVEKSKTN